MINNTEFEMLPNIGILTGSVTDELLSVIRKEIADIQQNKKSYNTYNHRLAGNLEEEYQLETSYPSIAAAMTEAANMYVRNYGYPISKIDLGEQMLDFIATKSWINFMKKHEFNPLHNHGGDLSYVIWVQIPFDMKDEMNLPISKNSNSPRPGTFVFSYNNMLGNTMVHPIYADKSYEGKFMMFPSGLWHAVYPFFTSDEYRISVSGNIKVKLTSDEKIHGYEELNVK